MAGGLGSRLRGTRVGVGLALPLPVEKPLLKVLGAPMIEHVLKALRESVIEQIYVAVSPHTPLTEAYVQSRAIVIYTPGEGYVEDLLYGLEKIGTSGPILTVAADLPLLSSGLIDRVLQAYTHWEGCSMAVCVPWALCQALGIRADSPFEHQGQTVVPTGLNVVVKDGHGEAIYIIKEKRLAVNVNRLEDVQICEKMLRGERL